MDDLTFYNDLGPGPVGWKRVVLLPRRLVRRVLRPIFQRQVQIYHDLTHRQQVLGARVEGACGALERLVARHAVLADDVRAASALGWDHAALARRLAALEDHFAAIVDAARVLDDAAPPAIRLARPAADARVDDERDSLHKVI
ncbi:MAG: hypothetical protein KGM43_09675 [Planctomycetota bacterium]|nr:hypothetical protein [Planctomycetota bacterium]